MNKYRVAGLMSGTSLDGVDIALCLFEKRKETWKFKIESAETIPYSHSQIKLLTGLMKVDAMAYAGQHAAYGRLLGDLVKSFLRRNNSSADFISSGETFKNSASFFAETDSPFQNNIASIFDSKLLMAIRNFSLFVHNPAPPRLLCLSVFL